MDNERLRVDYDIRKSFLFDLWLWKCGLQETNRYQKKVNFDSLIKSEWDSEFEYWFKRVVDYYQFGDSQVDTDTYFRSFVELMHNRLVMGAMRYGKLRDFERAHYDYMSGVIRYLGKYETTGNCELLVDVANYALIEYVRGSGVRVYDCPIVHLLRGSNSGLDDYIEAIGTAVALYLSKKEVIHLATIAALAMFAAMKKVHHEHHFEGSDNVELHCKLKL